MNGVDFSNFFLRGVIVGEEEKLEEEDPSAPELEVEGVRNDGVVGSRGSNKTYLRPPESLTDPPTFNAVWTRSAK